MVLFSVVVGLTVTNVMTSLYSLRQVYAERGEIEDEDEDSRDDERDEDDDDEYEYEYQYEEFSENVVVYKPLEPVIKYITVVEPGYGIDTDKDGLVDAIDPDPNIHQEEYFTDSDNDSVPDVLDAFPGEDDFYYIEFIDENNNGVVDFFEP
jgi:hypothetical protein